MQPEWRDVDSWPFSQDEGNIGSWGNLIYGGKDGLYIVVVTLAWWICSRDPTYKGSILNDAIANVSWVFDHLISLLLSSTTATQLDLLPHTHSTEKRIVGSVKTGPPAKCVRV